MGIHCQIFERTKDENNFAKLPKRGNMHTYSMLDVNHVNYKKHSETDSEGHRKETFWNENKVER